MSWAVCAGVYGCSTFVRLKEKYVCLPEHSPRHILELFIEEKRIGLKHICTHKYYVVGP